MEKVFLGDTGIQISKLGLGTVKFGRNTGVKFPKPFELPNDADILNLLNTADSLGINIIDTAPAYGTSEERLGKLLSNRSQWVIVTKVGEEFDNGNSFFNFSPEHAQKSIERSLKRLKTDYLDVVLVHSDGNDVYNIQHFGILDFLADLKKEGLIRSFGMSTKTVEGGLLALKTSDVVMMTYNPAYTDELPVIQEALKINKGIFIKKALMSGHLDKLSDKFNVHDPVQNAFQFILKEKGISSIILGTLNVSHLKHAASCVF